MNNETVRIFISYSHENEIWLTEYLDARKVKKNPKYLLDFWERSLRGKNVQFWYDHEEKQGIRGGDQWRDRIFEEIDKADIAILLITQDFVISPFIRDVELPHIMDRSSQGKIEILPILLEPARWKDLDINNAYQFAPGQPTPLSEYIETSEYNWNKVCLEVLEAIEYVIAKVERKKERKMVKGLEPELDANQGKNSEAHTVVGLTQKADLNQELKSRSATLPSLEKQALPAQRLTEAVNQPSTQEESTTIQRWKVRAPITDKVHFLANSPDTVERGQTFIFCVWAHIEKQRTEVMKRIKESISKADSFPIIQTKGPIEISRGTLLYVRVRFDDFKIEPQEEIVHWNGEIANASFLISIPNESKEGTYVGLVTIHWEGGLQIAKIPVLIRVEPKGKPDLSNTFAIKHIKKAFASYAHSDKDEVLGRIQGMQKILPDLEVFVDVLNLRSGEDWSNRLWKEIPQNDVFYLFWSESAQTSVWVEKEWRCALQTRGLDFIDPVPLVSPEIVQPPEELSQKHFNDWILSFKRGERK